MGATLESLTIGHNPYELPLAAHSVTLNFDRPKYLCEHLQKTSGLQAQSAGALLGQFANVKMDPGLKTV